MRSARPTNLRGLLAKNPHRSSSSPSARKASSTSDIHHVFLQGSNERGQTFPPQTVNPTSTTDHHGVFFDFLCPSLAFFEPSHQDVGWGKAKSRRGETETSGIRTGGDAVRSPHMFEAAEPFALRDYGEGREPSGSRLDDHTWTPSPDKLYASSESTSDTAVTCHPPTVTGIDDRHKGELNHHLHGATMEDLAFWSMNSTPPLSWHLQHMDPGVSRFLESDSDYPPPLRATRSNKSISSSCPPVSPDLFPHLSLLFASPLVPPSSRLPSRIASSRPKGYLPPTRISHFLLKNHIDASHVIPHHIDRIPTMGLSRLASSASATALQDPTVTARSKASAGQEDLLSPVNPGISASLQDRNAGDIEVGRKETTRRTSYNRAARKYREIFGRVSSEATDTDLDGEEFFEEAIATGGDALRTRGVEGRPGPRFRSLKTISSLPLSSLRRASEHFWALIEEYVEGAKTKGKRKIEDAQWVWNTVEMIRDYAKAATPKGKHGGQGPGLSQEIRDFRRLSGERMEFILVQVLGKLTRPYGRMSVSIDETRSNSAGIRLSSALIESLILQDRVSELSSPQPWLKRHFDVVFAEPPKRGEGKGKGHARSNFIFLQASLLRKLLTMWLRVEPVTRVDTAQSSITPEQAAKSAADFVIRRLRTCGRLIGVPEWATEVDEDIRTQLFVLWSQVLASIKNPVEWILSLVDDATESSNITGGDSTSSTALQKRAASTFIISWAKGGLALDAYRLYTNLRLKSPSILSASFLQDADGELEVRTFVALIQRLRGRHLPEEAIDVWRALEVRSSELIELLGRGWREDVADMLDVIQWAGLKLMADRGEVGEADRLVESIRSRRLVPRGVMGAVGGKEGSDEVRNSQEVSTEGARSPGLENQGTPLSAGQDPNTSWAKEQARLMKAHCRAGNLRAVEAIFGQVQSAHASLTAAESDRWSPIEVYEELVHAYVYFNDLAKASQVISQKMVADDVMPTLSIFNAMIQGYAQAADVLGALDILDRMRKAGFRPNRVTFTNLIQLFAGRRDPETAQRVLDGMIEDGIKPDVVAYTAVMNAYVEVGMWDEAIAIFDFLDHHPVKRMKPDVEACTTLLKAYVLHGAPLRTIVGVFKSIHNRGFQPTSQTFSLLLQALCDAGLMDQAEDVFSQLDIQDGSVRPNVFHFSIMIKGFLRLDKRQDAKAYFDEMKARGIKPTSVSYGIVIGAYSSTTTEEGFRIAEGLVRDALGSGVFTAGKRPWFEDRSLARGTHLHNFVHPIITSYAKNLQPEQALAVFGEVLSPGSCPSIPIFTSLMDAYRRSEDAAGVRKVWDELYRFVLEMRLRSDKASKDGSALGVPVEPSNRNLLCLPLSVYIDAMSTDGRLQEVLSTWEKMKEAGFAFDAANYNHLAVAFLRAQQHERAFRIVEDAILGYYDSRDLQSGDSPETEQKAESLETEEEGVMEAGEEEVPRTDTRIRPPNRNLKRFDRGPHGNYARDLLKPRPARENGRDLSQSFRRIRLLTARSLWTAHDATLAALEHAMSGLERGEKLQRLQERFPRTVAAIDRRRARLRESAQARRY